MGCEGMLRDGPASCFDALGLVGEKSTQQL